MRASFRVRVGRPLGLRAGRVTLTLGTVGILVLSGGIVYGAIPSLEDSVIRGCYENRTGLLRVIDADAGKTCTRWETPIAWSQMGPQGEPGPAGVAGADGADGADGVDGAPGAPGADGADGQNGLDGISVTSEALDPGEDPTCPHGGSKFTSSSAVTYACNGSDGEDFTGSFTSPNGLFSVTVTDTGATLRGPGGTMQVTAVGVSVQSVGTLAAQGSLITLNGAGCGMLRPSDFTIVGGGLGGSTASLLTGGGSTTVKFGC